MKLKRIRAIKSGVYKKPLFFNNKVSPNSHPFDTNPIKTQIHVIIKKSSGIYCSFKN